MSGISACRTFVETLSLSQASGLAASYGLTYYMNPTCGTYEVSGSTMTVELCISMCQGSYGFKYGALWS